MKVLLVSLALFLNSNNSQAQPSPEKIRKGIVQQDFQPDNLYLLMRGTRGKLGFIGKGFNLRDTNATHLAVGFYQGDNFVVYDVSPSADRGTKSCFKAQSFEYFIHDSDVYYLRVWQAKSSKAELERARTYVKTKLERKIVFDNKFNFRDDDTLYCTEFCVNLLNFVNKERFAFQLTQKSVGGTLVGKLLKRDTLAYYPVDFFVASRLFSPQKEYFVQPR